MRFSSIRALGFSFSLAVSITLVGCGSGSSSGGGGTPPPPQTQEFLFTDANTSVGSYSVDMSTGALSEIGYVPGNHNGFGIAANPSGTFLYTDDIDDDGIGVFSISVTGSLSPINGSPFAMPSGWSQIDVDSMAIHPSGKFLYVPDSASNQVVGFTIDGTTGALSQMSAPFPTGAGPQQVAIDPTGSFLYTSDYNDPNGGISAFTIDTSSGALTTIVGSPFPTGIAYGPDGLVVHPSGKFLYVSLPYDNSLAEFAIDGTTGALTPLAGSPFIISQSAFVIALSITTTPSGNFLYALGSQNAEVYGYSVDASSGALTSLAGSPFNISVATLMSTLQVDPSGKFLYVGVETGGMEAMNIDDTTGALTIDSALTTVAYGPSMTIIRVQ